MKRIIITTLMSIQSLFCFSQDLITKKSGEDIQAKVLEVGITELKYKKFDNENGATYTILKSDVLMVRYENGTKDIFNEDNKKSVPNSNKTTSIHSFFVEPTDEGYEQAIIDELLKLDKVITTKQEESYFTIKCIISKNGGWGVPGEGRIIILDSRTGNSLLTSKSAKSMVNVFRGFQNPRYVIMKKIANDYLYDLLIELNK